MAYVALALVSERSFCESPAHAWEKLLGQRGCATLGGRRKYHGDEGSTAVAEKEDDCPFRLLFPPRARVRYSSSPRA